MRAPRSRGEEARPAAHSPSTRPRKKTVLFQQSPSASLDVSDVARGCASLAALTLLRSLGLPPHRLYFSRNDRLVAGPRPFEGWCRERDQLLRLARRAGFGQIIAMLLSFARFISSLAQCFSFHPSTTTRPLPLPQAKKPAVKKVAVKKAAPKKPAAKKPAAKSK